MEWNNPTSEVREIHRQLLINAKGLRFHVYEYVFSGTDIERDVQLLDCPICKLPFKVYGMKIHLHSHGISNRGDIDALYNKAVLRNYNVVTKSRTAPSFQKRIYRVHVIWMGSKVGSRVILSNLGKGKRGRKPLPNTVDILVEGDAELWKVLRMKTMTDVMGYINTTQDGLCRFLEDFEGMCEETIKEYLLKIQSGLGYPTS